MSTPGNYYYGTALDFGATDVAITPIAGVVGTFILQDWTYEIDAEEDRVRNASGQTVNRTFYDEHAKAMFRYFISGTGLANAKTQVIIPMKGQLCAVTSTNYGSGGSNLGATDPTGSAVTGLALVGSNWMVAQPARLSATNTKNKEVTLYLEAYPLITAAASA